ATDDELMNNVRIYDVVQRRYAGFSKVLEDIHGVRVRKDLQRFPAFREDDVLGFHFLHWFHRFTGSGASFQPRYLSNGDLNPKEHGYCNSHVDRVAIAYFAHNFSSAVKYIVECDQPMVTSVGNQPPSLKNPKPEKYRL